MKCYRANGKLLLTGEYLVLKGALALALPTRLGQTLTVRHCEERSDEATRRLFDRREKIHWDASKPNDHWFSATFNENLEVLSTDDQPKAEKLADILKAVRQLNPSVFEPDLRFETHLDFDPEWGLGSSSTLISNLAQWAGVNPYELLKMTFGGSGYDIACATADGPIFYQLNDGQPQVSPAAFNPSFTDQLFFVYQGQKQQSSKEVKSFNQRMQEYDCQEDILNISKISRLIPTLGTFREFCESINAHEAIVARCLDREPIKSQFPDFEGSLKSLGAWGGDFFLAATPLPSDQVVNYFKNKGLATVFKYQDIIP